MSLRLREVRLANFRRFRQPVTLSGLTDGLNIVIEPNETGKSTLLEALRAGLFVRHSSRNQLTNSFAPHGEQVGPEVRVAFDHDGSRWTVTKRFLRSAQIELDGPGGRAQGDEAEARLHELFGSVRDTSQRGDPSSHGALGLLWIGQTEALSVSPPGELVRNTVRATLEGEVGSIMGGPAFDGVRSRVEAGYAEYWTNTGLPRQRQRQAEDAAAALRGAARVAKERLDDLDRSLSELDDLQFRLRILDRDLADRTDAEARAELVGNLEIARSSAQLLARRRAEHEVARSRLEALEDVRNRYSTTCEERDKAQNRVDQYAAERTKLADDLEGARARVETCRTELARLRWERQRAREVLTAAEETSRRLDRREAIGRGRARLETVVGIEAEQAAAQAAIDAAIPADLLKELEDGEREIATARAAAEAGATRIALITPGAVATLNGEPIGEGDRILTAEAIVSLNGAELRIRPPAGAATAEARLRQAVNLQADRLTEAAVGDVKGARALNQAARDATAELRAIKARMAAMTPADEILGIDAGPAALRAFLLEVVEDGEDEARGHHPDLDALDSAAKELEAAVVRAETAEEAAIVDLREIEEKDSPLATAQALASSNAENAIRQIETLETRSDFADIESTMVRLREEAAAAAVALAQAEEDATAYDASAIKRRIDVIDARAQTASDERSRLALNIARIESVVELEGGKGLAESAAMLLEEAAEAEANLARVRDEAAVLKLLRLTLDEARAEMSRTFVGPVVRRTKRHIERLLPGCELTFSEDLGLTSITRTGVSEGCDNLSRGTQEQLAVLTRLAFADMLLEQNRPVSLILDDPLAYSDDVRLDLMTEILLEAGERMQIIILTCRERAFRHVPANRVMMEIEVP
jgi:hypothetical protein